MSFSNFTPIKNVDEFSRNYPDILESALANSAIDGSGENLHSKDDFRHIFDPIYKFIELPKSIWRLVDTPQFQRLRFIKQLGVTAFVFNGANHTRFEHCLGVAHLAWKYLDAIATNHQFNYQEISLEDINHFHKIKLLVTIAGLCHDLGHGPFSHMFDNMLLPQLDPNNTWKHEKGSVMMLQEMFNDPQSKFTECPLTYKQAVVDPAIDLPVILDMIEGLSGEDYESKYGKNNRMYPKWVFDVVSNKTTSIDVDKLDYLQRDPAGMNLRHEYDWTMLFKASRVIDGEISYNSKLHDQIYDIFLVRYKLFKQVYQHRVSQSIELMLCDALQKANRVFEFLEMVKDPKQYLNLTDAIVQQILYSQDERLKESQVLINRVLRREIYRFVGEIVLGYSEKTTNEQFVEGISASYSNGFGKAEGMSAEEKANIVVIQSKLSYCFGDIDPISKVFFFKSSNPNVRKKLNSSNSSLIIPKIFGEKVVRVFVKVNNLELIAKVKSGFTNFTQNTLRKEERFLDKKDQIPLPEKKFKPSPSQFSTN